MDAEFVFLRVLHIVSGMFWAGSAMFLAFILEPRALGPAIQRPVMASLAPVMGPVLGLSGIITIAAGTTLAIRLRWDNLDKFFDTGWGYAILIGFIVSILAMAAGGMTEALSARMAKLGQEMGDGPPAPDILVQMESVTRRLTTASRTTAILVLIGVGSMASARFV